MFGIFRKKIIKLSQFKSSCISIRNLIVLDIFNASPERTQTEDSQTVLINIDDAPEANSFCISFCQFMNVHDFNDYTLVLYASLLNVFENLLKRNIC